MWLANNGVSNQTLNKETLCLGKIYTGREMFEGRKKECKEIWIVCQNVNMGSEEWCE